MTTTIAGSPSVSHRIIPVAGLDIFYPEAGAADAPVVVLYSCRV
jgi:hypothetical protein